MRTTLISMLAVIVISLGLCISSYFYVKSTTDTMENMTLEAVKHAESGNYTAVRENLIAIATYWEDSRPVMEMIASHEDIHEVSRCYIEAQVALAHNDMEDFYRALEMLRESTGHILAHESMAFANIF